MFEIVILTTIPNLTKTEFNTLSTIVTYQKQERIGRFCFFRDAQNTLLGDILVRLEICRVTGLCNNQLKFSTNEYGKPYLSNYPHIHYNISHTNFYIACAVANNPVGIDIESIQPIDLEIAARYFSPDEIVYIMDCQSTFRFFEIWTKKESRVKLEGKGLSKSLSSFSVLDSKGFDKFAYHNVFHNDEVICHACLYGKEKPTVRLINTIDVLHNIHVLTPQ